MEMRSRLKGLPKHNKDELIDHHTSLGAGNRHDYKKKDVDKLGFRHWFLIVAYIACIYAFVVYKDRCMPSIVPADQYERFSEVRAREFLNELTKLGSRPSGSKALEVDAYKIIMQRLNVVRTEVESRDVSRFEVDVQRPSGCFDLQFLSSFTLCYSKITNIIARIGSKVPAKHAILLNCHYDSVPDSPGASDDAVSCAIMMEILDIFSRIDYTFKADVIFLFNGAEENFLQASHGFTTKHPWFHTVRAFVNLEGAGAGGREILFQAGPNSPWLLEAYLENAPYPHCCVLAQEIFQAGLIPSDTDFRIFRDYGHISGLDIAYFRNGWVYHTEFDVPKFVYEGCIQRAGENVHALVKALIKSPHLDNSNSSQSNKWVFFDIFGMFTVFYSIMTAKICNYFTSAVIAITVYHRLHSRTYLTRDLLHAFLHHIMASLFMIGTGLLIVAAVIKLDLIMSWYKCPELIFPLYIFPMLLVGCAVHSVIASKSKISNPDMVQFDSILLIFAVILSFLTWKEVASAFFFLFYSFFLFLRDPFLFFMGKIGILKRVTFRWILAAQLICSVPVAAFTSYASVLLFDFFVPIFGRLGQALNPEYLIFPLSFCMASLFVLCSNNLVYLTRRMDYLLKCGFVLFFIFFLLLSTTRLGWPYYFSESSPRLRRLIALDTQRTIHHFQSNASTHEHALFVQAMDYRGVDDLPDHALFSGGHKPDCRGIVDEYCRLPFYTAIHQLFPPEESWWVPLHTRVAINVPIMVSLDEKVLVSPNEIKLSVTIRGGVDKMSLHISPLNDFKLKKWSFTNNLDVIGSRKTYFVFLSYGFEAPLQRTFWLHLEAQNESEISNLDDTECLELAVATHYAHGMHKESETLKQLRSLIAVRRELSHIAVGWWKWLCTAITGISQIVIHTF